MPNCEMAVLVFGHADLTGLGKSLMESDFQCSKSVKDGKKENQVWIILDSTLLPQEVFVFCLVGRLLFTKGKN